MHFFSYAKVSMTKITQEDLSKKAIDYCSVDVLFGNAGKLYIMKWVRMDPPHTITLFNIYHDQFPIEKSPFS